MYIYLISKPPTSCLEFETRLPFKLDLASISCDATSQTVWEVSLRELFYPRLRSNSSTDSTNDDSSRSQVAYVYMDIVEKSCVGNVQFCILRSCVLKNKLKTSQSINHLQFEKRLWFKLHHTSFESIEIKIDSDSDNDPLDIDSTQHPVVALIEIRKHEP